MSLRILRKVIAGLGFVALPLLSWAGQAQPASSAVKGKYVVTRNAGGGALLCLASAVDKSELLCEEFRKLLRVRGGLSPYKLELPPDPEGNVRINNIDVDGDGAVDEMVWSCSGSASIIPPDPCTLSVTLSSGKKIEFEESRFSLMRYASQVYAVAQDFSEVNLDNPNPADIKTKIYRVDGSGVHLVCSKLP